MVVFVINNQQTQFQTHPKVCRNTGTETGRKFQSIIITWLDVIDEALN